jgi:hypothetical protein
MTREGKSPGNGLLTTNPTAPTGARLLACDTLRLNILAIINAPLLRPSTTQRTTLGSAGQTLSTRATFVLNNRWIVDCFPVSLFIILLSETW